MKVKEREQTTSLLLSQSDMRLRVRRNQSTPLVIDRMHITLSGPAAKIPSVTNNRNTYAETRKARTAASLGVTGSAMVQAIKGIRAFSRKSEEQQMKIEVLNRLFRRFYEPGQVCFGDSKQRRFFLLVLLGSECNRFDSHNLTKFSCDWMQRDLGLFANDRNVDALALHKSSLSLPLDSATTELYVNLVDGKATLVLNSFIEGLVNPNGR